MFSVLIPTWNGLRFLPTCLDALRHQSYRDFETIIVDDASTDASIPFVKANFPEMRVIGLTKNSGFAHAVNTGIRGARGDIIVLLNNDTEADPHWLAEIAHQLDADPSAGIVACKLKLFDRRDYLHSAGDFYRVDGIPGNRGVWEKDDGQYDESHGVFGACGGAAAFRKSMLDEIGLFDEELVANLEDVDMNWRARWAGYGVAYAPRAVVYHHVSATGGGAYGSFYVGRNFIFILAKNYPSSLWKKHWKEILAAQLHITSNALHSWRGAAARARLRGQVAGVLGLRHWLKRRAELVRRVSDEAMEIALLPIPTADRRQVRAN